MSDRNMSWTLTRKTRSTQDIKNILAAGEIAAQTYIIQNGFVCLTDRRIIALEKSGMAGSRTTTVSIPYRSIEFWTTSDAEALVSVYADLTLYTQNHTVKLSINKNCDIAEVVRTIAQYTTR